MTSRSTPSIRFPAEWETQSELMLTWPSMENNAWSKRLQKSMHQCFSDIANTSLRYQDVLIVCNDDEHHAFIRSLLNEDKFKARFFQCQTDDAWTRDHGQITVYSEQQKVWNDFTFDGWGKKFSAHDDNLITAQLHQALFSDRRRISYKNVLEGGALETDGQGTLITTASCVLDKKRNPDVTAERFRALALNALGCDRVFILENGHIIGDDTDGHIDTLVRFADAVTLVYQSCFDTQDAHFLPLQKMENELKELRTRNGKPYRLIALPMPEAIVNSAGERLPASYANFLIINGAVLYPRYNDPADEEIASILKNAFPNRQIHGIDCSVLIEQYGSLHCVSMQLPA